MEGVCVFQQGVLPPDVTQKDVKELQIMFQKRQIQFLNFWETMYTGSGQETIPLFEACVFAVA